MNTNDLLSQDVLSLQISDLFEVSPLLSAIACKEAWQGIPANKRGVYMFEIDSIPVYIGKAGNVRSRCSTHCSMLANLLAFRKSACSDKAKNLAFPFGSTLDESFHRDADQWSKMHGLNLYDAPQYIHWLLSFEALQGKEIKLHAVEVGSKILGSQAYSVYEELMRAHFMPTGNVR